MKTRTHTRSYAYMLSHALKTVIYKEVHINVIQMTQGLRERVKKDHHSSGKNYNT